MRYIIDTDGHVLHISFGADIQCADATCIEYTGEIPNTPTEKEDAYTSLEDWYCRESDKLWRWKITSGQLVYDSAAVAPEAAVDPLALLHETRALLDTLQAMLGGVKLRGGAKVVQLSSAGTVLFTKEQVDSLVGGSSSQDNTAILVCNGDSDANNPSSASWAMYQPSTGKWWLKQPSGFGSGSFRVNYLIAYWGT